MMGGNETVLGRELPAAERLKVLKPELFQKLFSTAQVKRLEPPQLLVTTSTLVPEPFEGRSSLLAFLSFRLLFYRGKSGRIYGRTESAAEPLLGPGYFQVEEDRSGLGSLVIRYDALPPPEDRPKGWPPVATNDFGLASFTFGKLEIHLRQVDGDFYVGPVRQQGRDLGVHAALARVRSR